MTDSGGYIIGKVSALRQSGRIMETPSKILFLVLFTLSMGEPAKDDIEIMKEMMLEMKIEMRMEMNEKLARTEEDLAVALTDLATTKEDLATTKEDLAATRDDLATALNDLATQDDLATTKDDLATTKTALMELELEVTRVKEPPFIHACGSHNTSGLSIQSGTIPYSRLLYSSTNQETGGLDTETGVFTAPHPGSYTVTWSTLADNDAEDHSVYIYLYKNGQRI